ncbi:hypothetical protein SRHO_G00237040 [Serrasalmus rhombeus]
MSLRFREVRAQVQLTQSRHQLLQLQTQDQLCSLHLKRITERMHSQHERLQDLTMQNQRLRNLLGQTTEEEQHKLIASFSLCWLMLLEFTLTTQRPKLCGPRRFSTEVISQENSQLCINTAVNSAEEVWKMM